MGTLGCMVCRELIGWGVKNFVLIDCGVVAPSNPARQSLYLAADVSRTPKVLVAKHRLLQIRNDLNIEAHNWEIPMPNQQRFNLPLNNFVPDCPPQDALEPYAEWITRQLTQLIRNCHGVWLLTDNRESRWLPSLITQQLSLELADPDFLRDESRAAHRQGLPATNLATDLAPDLPADLGPHLTADLGPHLGPDLGPDLGAHLRTLQQADAHDQGCRAPKPESARGAPAVRGQEDVVGAMAGGRPQVDVVRKRHPFYPPLCYTVALGFDTFVAMRHGSYVDCSVAAASRDLASPYDVYGARLSCYFCNDLTAPGPVAARRALDQQCTVTRAGVAGWAAAMAVEAVAAMTQTDYGWGCAPPDRLVEARARLQQTKGGMRPGGETTRNIRKWLLENPRHLSCLGDSPHVIRGSLGTFNLAHNWHPAFPLCVCCGVKVQMTFRKYKEKFVSSVVQDSSRLELISGVSEFACQSVREDVLSYTNIVDSDDENAGPSN
ncbi:ThiF family protein [Gregarina niphandrodes]|uniref:ThiF family protein n=1 Tax=Gregarina niphandrodes TaxID=110365 RepID=A0A023B3S4_GRENI|nr:ThiF family protein [Gregarina niphandrodes]EZG55935.1 ThiF family protein [Gregarina niphandrodes]|eukprot:XP_011131409.1 ThiF family protein [Gregarina niphandrodes]